MLAVLALVTAIPGLSAALAQPAKVVITGGYDSAGQRPVATSSSDNSPFDASGQNYAWIIANNHTSPIVYIEIPHYHADTFRTPEGWSQKCTNLRMINGGEDAPGVCTATAAPPNTGILPGGRANFGLRLEKLGANKGTGSVKVRFADGTDFVVRDVSLPVAPHSAEQAGTVAVLAGAFVIFLAIQAARRRKRRATGTVADAQPP